MAEKHHYLPVFYLKEFIGERPPSGQEPYLWIYSFDKEKWKNKAPKKVASEPDLYAVDDEYENKRYDVERALSKLEGKMAPIYKMKIKSELVRYDRSIIAEFVSLMIIRTLKYKKMVSDFVVEIANKIIHCWQSQPTYYRAFIELYKTETGKDMPEKLPPDLLANLDIQASPDFFVEMMIKLLPNIKNDIIQMNWTFLYAKDQDYFITSDSPVTFFNPDVRLNFGGYDLKNSEFYFPLSKEICMILSHNFKLRQTLDVPISVVETINKRTVYSSHKFVIAPKKDFIGASYLKSKSSTYIE